MTRVCHDRSPMSPWAAAHLWAEAVVEFGNTKLPAAQYGDRECVMLTRAITTVAEAHEIGPEHFSSVPLSAIHLNALHDVTSIRMFAERRGANPENDDPGFATDHEFWLMATTAITSAALAENSDQLRTVERLHEEWESSRQRARNLIFAVIVEHATEWTSDPVLGSVGHTPTSYVHDQQD